PPLPSGITAAAAASSWISVKWNSPHGLVYWPHHATPSASSSTRSWRSPASSTTKKLRIVIVRPSLSSSCRSSPTRSKPATCSGPSLRRTMPALSSVMSPEPAETMLPAAFCTMSVDTVTSLRDWKKGRWAHFPVHTSAEAVCPLALDLVQGFVATELRRRVPCAGRSLHLHVNYATVVTGNCKIHVTSALDVQRQSVITKLTTGQQS